MGFERGHLKWFGYVLKMPSSHLLGVVFQACPTIRRPWGRARILSRDHIFPLAWEHLGVPLEELEECDRDVLPS